MSAHRNKKDSRYLELNGTPIGSRPLANLFNRWSLGVTLLTSAVIYGGQDNPEKKAESFRHLAVGLAVAALVRTASSTYLRARLGPDLVIDTHGKPHFSHEERKEHQLQIASELKFHKLMTAYTVAGGASVLGFLHYPTGIPIAAEAVQHLGHLNKLRSGQWTLVHRNEITGQINQPHMSLNK